MQIKKFLLLRLPHKYYLYLENAHKLMLRIRRNARELHIFFAGIFQALFFAMAYEISHKSYL